LQLNTILCEPIKQPDQGMQVVRMATASTGAAHALTGKLHLPSIEDFEKRI